MIIRELHEGDQKAVQEIFSMYWTDPEFLEELKGEVNLYTNNILKKDQGFFVAEEGGEILGIVGFKKLPDYLKVFSATNNPVEFYVIAVKYKGNGLGLKLKSKLIEETRERGFSEILLYSPKSHSESWVFHDKLGFERVGEVTPPEDEIGAVWRKYL